MSTQNTNITEKNIKTIQVSLAGLSFLLFDTLNNTITSFNEVHFDSFHKEIKIEVLFNAFRDYPELKETYDDVIIHNNLSTFVPLRSLMRISWGYLQYNTKVLKLIFCA
jgi:hypothetical protein